MEPSAPYQATVVGIIGGSGLYQLEGLTDVRVNEITTPFGSPSDRIVSGRLHGKPVHFLPRHGKGHRLLPSEVNARANIWALKSLGVTHVVSVSAVGSLVEAYRPGDVVIPDSVLDRTMGLRPSTFFGEGVVGHVSFADPYCPELRNTLARAAALCAPADQIHQSGTLVCIEGPRFSTRAESHHYRSVGASIIGMTVMPEAVLAREAEMAYATLAFVTDYDCWHESEAPVTVEAVLAVLAANVEKSRRMLDGIIKLLPESSANPLFQAARFAVMTDPRMIPLETKRKLELLYGKYWG
jgi:5'-methylthioadenosine phosphorylase